jgi:succinate dehydrogenase hydrophobic anchor subunit
MRNLVFLSDDSIKYSLAASADDTPDVISICMDTLNSKVFLALADCSVVCHSWTGSEVIIATCSNCDASGASLHASFIRAEIRTQCGLSVLSCGCRHCKIAHAMHKAQW